MYKLNDNQPDFEVVDGSFANRKYKAGALYSEVPPEEAHKFDVIESYAAESQPANATPEDIEP